MHIQRANEISPLANFLHHGFRVDNEYLKPNWDESVDRFDDMGLKEEVLRGIYGYGFNKPSPIQTKGILPVIQGHDTIA
jgi:translation initiation factor 4A